jgi:hypothetical protein
MVEAMNANKICAAALVSLFLATFSARGQYLYRFVFQGYAYQTNPATGNIVATPITDQTLLADRAQAGGITNLSTVAIVYHINGDPKGDTVEIWNTNGTQLTFEFGLWFGDDASLGRTALTNASQTEIRVVQYVYTLDSSTYTYANSDSLGAAFITKRFLTDTNGNVHPTIEGPISWEVMPQNGRGAIVCSGNFTLGTALVP